MNYGKQWKIVMVCVITLIILSPLFTATETNHFSDFFLSEDLEYTVLRQPAEFETMESVLINYGAENTFSIPYSVIRKLAELVNVVVIVDTAAEWEDAKQN